MNHKNEIKEMLEMMAQFSREHEEMQNYLLEQGIVRVDDEGEFIYWVDSGDRVGAEKSLE